MIRLFVSDFRVQKLGWTLLHFLWQGTAIAVLYSMARAVLTRWLSAQGRYVLACAALMAIGIAPPLTFLLIRDGRGSAAWTLSPAESQRLLSAVVTLWLLGVVAFSIRLLAGWRFMARLCATSHPAPAEWRRTLERIGARVGATQRVRLRVSSLVDVPTVIGWLRPAILVPVKFFTGLSLEHITALLAHEMAHIRRHDYVVNMAQSIAEAVLFYHPAVWWISEQIRAERELCCDDLAVAATGDALAYARALAELESRQPARLTPALAANGGSLVNRVRRLIEPTRMVANSTPGPATACAMTLLWLAGASLAVVHVARTPSAAGMITAPVPAPAPAGLIAIADKARNTLLYDPLLPPQSVPPNDNAAVAPGLQAESNPEPPPPVIIADTTGSQLPAQSPIAPPTVPAQTAPPPTLSEKPSQTSHEEARPQAPTFSAATRLVQVDVIARRRGTPANGLTKDDFTLLDNGKPQNIAVFSVTSSQTSGPAPVPLPAGAVSNRLERGADALANPTVVLIDRINTAPADQAFAIRRIVKFLRTRRNKDSKPDRIGIYTFGRDGLRAVQEITDDADLLKRAADSLNAGNASYDYRPERMMETKHAFEAIARHLAQAPGRKGLIWVTDGFPLATPEFDANADMEEAARALNDADVALYAVDARGLVGSLSGMTAVSNAEFRGTESSHPWPLLQLTSTQRMSAQGGSPDGIDAMAKLAGLTGGLALYNTNGIEDSIRKALDDAELTYTLGFYPGHEDRERPWHKLKIEVARPGVSVRYRGKYFAAGALPASDRPTLPELLKVPLDATQLQLVAETMPDPARPDFRQVRVSLDLHQVHLENQNDIWAGAVDISFFLEGSRTAQRIARNFEIPDGQLAAALKRGIEVENSIGVGGQTGELRIVAQDRTTGAAGSLRVPLGNK